MVNSWILAWYNALRDNSNREVTSNLHMEQQALTRAMSSACVLSEMMTRQILYRCGLQFSFHNDERIIVLNIRRAQTAKQPHRDRELHREGETERQRDRETDRQTQTQTDLKADLFVCLFVVKKFVFHIATNI